MIRKEFSKVHQTVMPYWTINFRANGAFKIITIYLEKAGSHHFTGGITTRSNMLHVKTCKKPSSSLSLEQISTGFSCTDRYCAGSLIAEKSRFCNVASYLYAQDTSILDANSRVHAGFCQILQFGRRAFLTCTVAGFHLERCSHPCPVIFDL